MKIRIYPFFQQVMIQFFFIICDCLCTANDAKTSQQELKVICLLYSNYEIQILFLSMLLTHSKAYFGRTVFYRMHILQTNTIVESLVGWA